MGTTSSGPKNAEKDVDTPAPKESIVTPMPCTPKPVPPQMHVPLDIQDSRDLTWGDLGVDLKQEYITGRVGLHNDDVKNYVEEWVDKLSSSKKSFWIVRGHQHKAGLPIKTWSGQKDEPPCDSSLYAPCKSHYINRFTQNHVWNVEDPKWNDRILTFSCAGTEQTEGYGPGSGFGVWSCDDGKETWTMNFDPKWSPQTKVHIPDHGDWNKIETQDLKNKLDTLLEKMQEDTTGAFNEKAKPWMLSRVADKVNKVAVIGDIHGNWKGLIWNFVQLREQNFFKDQPPTFNLWNTDESVSVSEDCAIIFTGDLLDRGYHDFEVWYAVYKLAVDNPRNVFICQGNHEHPDQYRLYGFSEHVKDTFCIYDGDYILNKVQQCIDYMPKARFIVGKNVVFQAHHGMYNPVHVAAGLSGQYGKVAYIPERQIKQGYEEREPKVKDTIEMKNPKEFIKKPKDFKNKNKKNKKNKFKQHDVKDVHDGWIRVKVKQLYKDEYQREIKGNKRGNKHFKYARVEVNQISNSNESRVQQTPEEKDVLYRIWRYPTDTPGSVISKAFEKIREYDPIMVNYTWEGLRNNKVKTTTLPAQIGRYPETSLETSSIQPPSNLKENPMLSRTHGSLKCLDGKVTYTDQSTYGTQLKKKDNTPTKLTKNKPIELNMGDTLCFPSHGEKDGTGTKVHFDCSNGMKFTSSSLTAGGFRGEILRYEAATGQRQLEARRAFNDALRKNRSRSRK